MMTLNDIPFRRVAALNTLLDACARHNVAIEQVTVHLNGPRVTFVGFHGDAVLNDWSYGNTHDLWETMGFPWDTEQGDEVSVHDAETLASLLGALIAGD